MIQLFFMPLAVLFSVALTFRVRDLSMSSGGITFFSLACVIACQSCEVIGL